MLPHLAGAGAAGQHPGADQPGAQPHLYRVVPQPGVQLQHHRVARLRPGLCGGPHRLRGDGAADRRAVLDLCAAFRRRRALFYRVLRRQAGDLRRHETVGHRGPRQRGDVRPADPALLLRRPGAAGHHVQPGRHPRKLSRQPAAAGQHRHRGVDLAKAAVPHRQGLPGLWQAGADRHLRRRHRGQRAGLPEILFADGGRHRGPRHLVQDQLYLRVGQRSGRTDQRRRGIRRSGIRRGMAGRGAAAGFHRRACGAGAVLAFGAFAV